MTVSVETQATFLRAIDLFDSRVRATPEESWSSPSPCEGWTARDVVAHAVTNLRALRSGVGGGDFFASFGDPVEGDIAAAWAQQRAGAAALARDVGKADAITVGGKPIPPSMMIDALTRDLVIHTWDLARAVNGDEQLPDDLVAAATALMASVGPEQRVPGLYGQQIPVASDADALTRLLALSGRKAH